MSDAVWSVSSPFLQGRMASRHFEGETGITQPYFMPSSGMDDKSTRWHYDDRAYPWCLRPKSRGQRQVPDGQPPASPSSYIGYYLLTACQKCSQKSTLRQDVLAIYVWDIVLELIPTATAVHRNEAVSYIWKLYAHHIRPTISLIRKLLHECIV